LTLRLLQITDTHLFADRAGRLKGIDTTAALNAVIDTCHQRHPVPELVLLTGDLSHDGSAASYRRVAEAAAALDAPVLAIPGNHDDPAVMRQSGLGRERYRLMPGWQIIMLDSTVTDEEQGRLAEDELAFLDDRLSRHPDRHALIALHHHPVPVGSRWLDAIGLENGHALFGITRRHPQVRVLVFGHIHQAFDKKRDGIRLLGTPASCVQFRPRADDFSLDALPPGYRLLELSADGAIATEVVRLPAQERST